MAVYGSTIIVNNYKISNSGGSCDINGSSTSVSRGDFEATEQITFTGVTKLFSSDPNIRVDTTFIAPVLIFQSQIGVNKNGYNSLTLNSQKINLNDVTWNSSSSYGGPISFTNGSKLYLNAASNGKTLIKANTLSGTIKLNIDSAVTDTVSFSVQTTVANNLVVETDTGYTVSSTISGTTTTYTATIVKAEVKQLNVGSISYKIKDEEARTSLENKLDKNTAITAGTNTKITYDANGLVTSGTTLSASDIPDISATYYLASNPSNYISGITSSMVTTALGYTPYNSTNPAGYITGITSSDVTTALGYTPYNSTNPNGYQTSSQVSTAITGSIVNVVTSSSTTTSLSANMGKALQDQITNLKGIGRFLALWNCATGLAESNPTTSPRTYNSGDYFVVGTTAVAGGTNYRPDGTEYVIGQASTTVETASVAENDVYFYDGTNWTLQNNHGGLSTVSFSNITGQPTDNTNLATALNAKADSDDLGTLAYADMITSGDIDGTIPYAKLSGVATSAQGTKADTAIQPNDNITQLNNNAGYITSAVDDSSTTSTTLGWSASKLNTTIGNVEALILAL